MGSEVVDDRYFDFIHKKAVFVGCTSSDQDVVSEAWRARYAGQGLNYSGDVSIPTWVALDFIGVELSYG